MREYIDLDLLCLLYIQHSVSRSENEYSIDRITKPDYKPYYRPETGDFSVSFLGQPPIGIGGPGSDKIVSQNGMRELANSYLHYRFEKKTDCLVKFYLARRPRPNPTPTVKTLTLTLTSRLWGARGRQGRSRGFPTCFVGIFPKKTAGRRTGLKPIRHMVCSYSFTPIMQIGAVIRIWFSVCHGRQQVRHSNKPKTAETAAVVQDIKRASIYLLSKQHVS